MSKVEFINQAIHIQGKGIKTLNSISGHARRLFEKQEGVSVSSTPWNKAVNEMFGGNFIELYSHQAEFEIVPAGCSVEHAKDYSKEFEIKLMYVYSDEDPDQEIIDIYIDGELVDLGEVVFNHDEEGIEAAEAFAERLSEEMFQEEITEGGY